MAPPLALISTELELPVVSLADGTPPLPQVFLALWGDLATRGWTPGDFSVTRDHPSEGPCISSNQAMSTDTGPIIELVASPSTTRRRRRGADRGASGGSPIGARSGRVT